MKKLTTVEIGHLWKSKSNRNSKIDENKTFVILGIQNDWASCCGEIFGSINTDGLTEWAFPLNQRILTLDDTIKDTDYYATKSGKVFSFLEGFKLAKLSYPNIPVVFSSIKVSEFLSHHPDMSLFELRRNI